MKITLTIASLLCYISSFAQAGALDTTFANKGMLNNQNEYSSIISINAVTVQKDGKIIVAGTGYTLNSHQANDFAVMRINKNGTIDSSFGIDGKVIIDFSTAKVVSDDVAYGLAVQPDGKIVVAGSAADYYAIDEGSEKYNYYDMAIARINADGSLDTAFDGDGKRLIDLSSITFSNTKFTNASYDYCRSVAVRPNGKIVMAGYAYVAYEYSGGMPTYEATVLQLNKNGSFDSTFDTDGIKIVKELDNDETIYGMALQQDGKILLAGTQSSYYDHFILIRLTLSGALDKSFHSNGTVIDTALRSFGTSVIMQPDGKILAGGYKYDSYNIPSSTVARFNTDGSQDKSFNSNGVNEFSRQNDRNKGWALALQSDGKIIQSGEQESYGINNLDFYGSTNFQVLRYNTNGVLDTSFGAYGRSVIDFNNWINKISDVSYACAIQGNKIIAAGEADGASAVARLQTAGKSVILTGPADQSDSLPKGQCTAAFNNINPVLTPATSDTSYSSVKYSLYTNGNTVPFDSGYGSVSGKQFGAGLTTIVYTLKNNSLQRTVFGVNITGGKTAGALDFDGIDDRVDAGYLDPIGESNNEQYSFEAWINVRAYNKEGSVIFGNERNNNGGIVVGLNSKGYVSTYQREAGNVFSTYKVALNKWTHIAFVQSSAKLDLYVNGAYVQTLLTAPYLHLDTYDEEAYLGAYTSDYTNFSRHFNGKIEDVKIWNRPICESQIDNNLNCAVLTKSSGLYAYFSFNQGIASCRNLGITQLQGFRATGYLQNFALDGPESNWVKGYINGTCKKFVPLTFKCPKPITVQADSGACSAIVNFAATAYSDCSDSVSVTYSQNPGTAFPVGTTYVDVTAKNDYGDVASCQFSVTVKEKDPPYLVTKDTTITLTDDGSNYILPSSVVDTVHDNCGSDQLNVGVNPARFDCSGNIGANTVNVIATDRSGNTTQKTAIVTVLPYITTSGVEAVPSAQQYSDPAALKATIYNLANAYYNSCYPASGVTFKIGSKVIGTARLNPDYYTHNLVGSFNYTLSDPRIKKVTAIFNDTITAFNFPDTVITYLNPVPEDAVIEYTGAQIIESSTNKLTLPVAATITDSADGYRGDIRNAIVTFTLKPVTKGATVSGVDSITVPALEFLNSDNTSGTARANFNVSTGGNANAQFAVTVNVSNYYTGNQYYPVLVTKPGSSMALSKSKIASSTLKLFNANAGFNVIISPNPSQDHYTIQVQSNNKSEKVSIKISDITGKILETFSNINTSDIIKLGYKYAAGTYVAEITQGQNKKVFKLIKL